jgi:hypothetical protein
MDFSEIYLNMCVKGREIQLAHSTHEAGDFYYDGKDPISLQNRFSLIPESMDGKERTIASLKSFWLPRQDQLQAMIGDYPLQCKLIAPHIMKMTIFDAISSSQDWIESMEQLWMSIVMKEKYSKVWKQTDWIKATG